MPALLKALHRANQAHGCSCPHSFSKLSNQRQKHVVFSWKSVQQILHTKLSDPSYHLSYEMPFKSSEYRAKNEVPPTPIPSIPSFP